MFKIFTRRCFGFRNPKTGEKVTTAFMGFTPVPDWVRDQPMYKQGVNTGSIEVIQSVEQQKELENSGETNKLAELRARAVELKIPRATQLGEGKLLAAITEAEAKLNPPDLLADMDADELRQFAKSNEIDISGVAEGASVDDLRAAIKAAPDS